jgi:hypothetical protein
LAAPCRSHPEIPLGAAWAATSNFNRVRDYAPAAQFFAIIDGLAAGGDCTESDSEGRTFEFGGPDAGWGYIPGAPIARDAAAAAVSPDGQIFVFVGETRSACCIGEYGSVSFSYLGSYDVFDLDAGAWEPTHGG